LEGSLEQAYDIWGALDTNGECSGYLYVDDYLQVTTDFYLVHFSISATTITIEADEKCSQVKPLSQTIDQIKIFGFPTVRTGETVTVSSEDTTITEWIYNGEANSLRIFNLDIDWCEKKVTINISID